MSARLDKVHISPGQNPHHTNWRKRHHRRETFEEIEQRLTDSSDDEMSDDNEPCSSKKEKVYSEEQSVQLSDELKKFIKRSIEKPVIIPSPSVMNAVVPYVPHRSFEEYSMNSRISEIAEDDTEWHSCIQPDGAVGSVSFPEESSSSDECPSGNGKRTDSEQSNFLAIVEVEEFPDENTDVEMDCS
ncbi:unnamed protein product [Toxocara canis]|uniref:Uncharacterized protein n=1 Tax=Toxocara canis TaxID=6265 RepID=A0A183UJ78_TOXCA|nr:unnamed protein product [Toxocara canis]